MGIAFNPESNTITLEDGTQVPFEEWALHERGEVPPDKAEIESLKEFFFGKKPELTQQGIDWKKDGKCPKCGELGRIHLSTFVCSTHGPY